MPDTQAQATEFQCHAQDAGEVYLTGTFNDWNPEALLMTKDGRGSWDVRLDLPRGRYQYQFIVDGRSSGSQTVRIPPGILDSFPTPRHDEVVHRVA